MKPKNKEVNIFNMSLLDILCGALGAFCFMMLVLFQYWKPEGPETKQAKVDTAKLEQQLKDALNQMKNMSNLPPDVAARLQRMEKDFAALQEQVAKLKSLVDKSQAQAEAFRRQADAAEGRAKSAEAESAGLRKDNARLRDRNPIAIGLQTLTNGHQVDLYVKDPKMDEPDPLKIQGKKWNGDVFYNNAAGPGTDVWLMRDAPAQEYKVYYKFMSKGDNPEPAQVIGFFMHHEGYSQLPPAKLTQEKTVAFVGTIVVSKDYSSEFKPSAEYEPVYKEFLETRRKAGRSVSTGQKPMQQAPAPGAEAPKPQ